MPHKEWGVATQGGGERARTADANAHTALAEMRTEGGP